MTVLGGVAVSCQRSTPVRRGPRVEVLGFKAWVLRFWDQGVVFGVFSQLLGVKGVKLHVFMVDGS